jgi:hypothetical protein
MRESPVRTPVQAVEWACQAAATTIKDANGSFIAECCSGCGWNPTEDMAVAAEIVRRINLHDELLEALTNLRDQIKTFTEREGEADFYIGKANAVIAKANGSKT